MVTTNIPTTPGSTEPESTIPTNIPVNGTIAPTDSPAYLENPNGLQVSIEPAPYQNPYVSYSIIGVGILVLLILAFMALKS